MKGGAAISTPITDKEIIGRLLTEVGGKFSRELGIDLTGGDRAEIFRWFLASKLFAARISTAIAARTFREFERRGAVTPERIEAIGWDGLVSILDAGGYARYDFSTATRLLAIVKVLSERYGGDFNAVHERAQDSADLERLLKELGSGIGEVTLNVFLRELRNAWPKARPRVSALAHAAAVDLGLVSAGGADDLQVLERLWSGQPVPGRDFCDFEAALVRLGKDYCSKGRHLACPFRDLCRSADALRDSPS